MAEQEKLVTMSVTFRQEDLKVIQDIAAEAKKPYQEYLSECMFFGSISVEQILLGRTPYYHDEETEESFSVADVLDEREDREIVKAKIVRLEDYQTK